MSPNMIIMLSLRLLDTCALVCAISEPLSPPEHEIACCAIMIYDAGLAGCLAGTVRGNCAGGQAMWQLMRISVQCAATCQLLVSIALFWCMLMLLRCGTACSLCWHCFEQSNTGDLVNAQRQGACLSTYFLLQSGFTLLTVGCHTLLH